MNVPLVRVRVGVIRLLAMAATVGANELLAQPLLTNLPWVYTLYASNHATIVSYIGSSSSVALPADVDGYAVRKLGDSGSPVFASGSAPVRKVSIPESVRTIGSNALANSSFLTNAVIDPGLRRIESGAFAGCINLRSVTIPETVTEIEDNAFAGCSKITDLDLPWRFVPRLEGLGFGSQQAVDLSTRLSAYRNAVRRDKTPSRLSPLRPFYSVKAKSITFRGRATDNLSPVRVQFRVKSPGTQAFGPWSDRSFAAGRLQSKPWSYTLELSRRGAWQLQIRVFDGARNASRVTTVDVDRLATPAELADASTQAGILATMEHVADWQFTNPGKHPPTDWTQAAFYTGVMALAEFSPSPRFLEAMLRMGERNRWKLGPLTLDANDHCVGQTYAELYLKTPRPKMIAAMRAQFNRILANPPELSSLDFKGQNATSAWSWCDALFMGPPAWTRLARATGNPRYLDFAITNWWRTSDFLYDRREHLYFRDSTYFKRTEANGKKVFWSRGNGWVVAGLVRVLQDLPPGHPMRPRFETQFKQMCSKLLACQGADGLWRASLLDPKSFPLKESSGSGFFLYALAYGVNQGLLERSKFAPAVRRGWAALTRCVEPDGKLTHVQPIGGQPRRFSPDSTEVYGVGAFLLAGSEVYRLEIGEDDSR